MKRYITAATSSETLYLCSINFRSYDLTVIDVSEEAGCKKLFKKWKEAVKQGGYEDDSEARTWQDLRDYGIQVFPMTIGKVEWL